MALTNKGQFKIYADNSGSKGSIVGIYNAASMKQSYESLASEDSGRSDDGVMHITWIRTNVRKIEIEMPPYTNSGASDMSTLLTAVQGKTYWIEYFDTAANAETTKRVYTSNSAASCYSGVISNGMWTGLAFNAIEV